MFADFREHSNPLFIKLNILKFNDIIRFQTAVFMYDFHHGNLPDTFKSFFSLVSNRHNYNTRLASSKTDYSLPSARTNYGKFNIRFSATKVWNSLDKNLRQFTKAKFKKIIFAQIINSYHNEPWELLSQLQLLLVTSMNSFCIVLCMSVFPCVVVVFCSFFCSFFI